MIVNLARTYAAEQCEHSRNRLSKAFFHEHILPVDAFAMRLADRLGADREIVEIASYLHDISAVEDIETLRVHPERSAKIAVDLLSHWEYPGERIVDVRNCIAAHSTPLPPGAASPEEVCLSQADAMALIARIPYWFYFAFKVRGLVFEEGKQWIRDRVEKNWSALIPPAREMIATEYEAARVCLQ